MPTMNNKSAAPHKSSTLLLAAAVPCSAAGTAVDDTVFAAAAVVADVAGTMADTVVAAGGSLGDDGVADACVSVDNEVAVAMPSAAVAEGVIGVAIAVADASAAGVMVEPVWLESGVRVGGTGCGVSVADVGGPLVGVALRSSVGVIDRRGVGEGTVWF